MTLQDSRAINNYGTATWSGAIPNQLGPWWAATKQPANATFATIPQNSQPMGAGAPATSAITKEFGRYTTFRYPITFKEQWACAGCRAGG